MVLYSARVAELADALASGASDSNIVQVQPLSRAPHIDIYKHMWYNLQHKLCLIISSRKAIFVCLTSLSCQNPPLPPPSEAPFHLRNASFAQGYHLAYAAQKEKQAARSSTAPNLPALFVATSAITTSASDTSSACFISSG